jgi:hypothetical protein
MHLAAAVETCKAVYFVGKKRGKGKLLQAIFADFAPVG